MPRLAVPVLFGLILLTPFTSFSTPPASAQPSQDLESLKKEMEALRQGQARILRELQELRNVLAGRQPARPAEFQPVVLSMEAAPFRGDARATLTLVEFSDYQCPFCGRHARDTLPQLDREYVKTGKVKYVFRDFPIEALHPQAFKGHEAAYCAGEQGKYWEMHHRLFASQQAMAPNDLANHAQALGLDAPRFQQCLESEKYAATVRKGLTDGQIAGVNATPTFFLGFTEADDTKVRAVRMLRGALPYPTFKETLDSLLASPKK